MVGVLSLVIAPLVITGNVGAVESNVYVLAAAVEVLPAASVLDAVMTLSPSASLTVAAHLPFASTVVVASTVVPSLSTVTRAPASPVPLTLCTCWWVVMPLPAISTVGITVSTWIVVEALSLT